jgi:hypothetical protein
LHQDPEYVSWAQKMASTIDQHPFAAKRLREWSLFRSITLARAWSPAELVAASDWLQRKVTEGTTSSQALALLAEAGRTRRVRNTATSKVNSKH